MFAMTEEGNDVLSGHPALTAWLERIEARPSMQATTWEKLLGGGPIWGTTSGRRGRKLCVRYRLVKRLNARA